MTPELEDFFRRLRAIGAGPTTMAAIRDGFPQQRRDPAIAVTSILAGELHDGLGECILIFALCQLIALRAAWLVHQSARSPLTHAFLPGMIYCTTPSIRA